jgi:hypothetical protein
MYYHKACERADQRGTDSSEAFGGLGKKYLDFAFAIRNTISRQNYSVSVLQLFLPVILLISENIRALLVFCLFFSFSVQMLAICTCSSLPSSRSERAQMPPLHYHRPPFACSPSQLRMIQINTS